MFENDPDYVPTLSQYHHSCSSDFDSDINLVADSDIEVHAVDLTAAPTRNQNFDVAISYLLSAIQIDSPRTNRSVSTYLQTINRVELWTKF